MKKSLILLGLLASLNANANLIQNGSFEDIAGGSTDPYGSNFAFFSDKNPLTSWQRFDTTATNYAEVINNSAGLNVATAGLNYLELDTGPGSNTNGGISQSFASIVGEEFMVSFDFSPRRGTLGLSGLTNDTSNIEFYWNNNLVATLFLGLQDSTQPIWQTYTAILTSEGNLTTFGLKAAGRIDEYGGAIDNIVVTRVAAVPEPETYGMMMLGLAILGFASRRRKQ